MRRIVVALGLLLVAAPACEHVHKAAPKGDAPKATLVVSKGFGAQRVLSKVVAPGQSLMAALETVAKVDVNQGGRYIQAVDGTQGSRTRQVDWFWYVNGIAGDRAASEFTLRKGDRGLIDYHDWADYLDTPAIVGAFPEPFVHGFRGARPAVQVSGSPALATALRAEGVHEVPGSKRWRILVGGDAALRADPRYRQVSDDPGTAGVTAAIQRGRVLVYDGHRMRPVSGARVVVWAAASSSSDGNAVDGVLLAIAGLDAASASKAARVVAANPAVLAGRFAAAFDGAGHVVATGGRP
jgi:hypothetical protein